MFFAFDCSIFLGGRVAIFLCFFVVVFFLPPGFSVAHPASVHGLGRRQAGAGGEEVRHRQRAGEGLAATLSELYHEMLLNGSFVILNSLWD